MANVFNNKENIISDGSVIADKAFGEAMTLASEQAEDKRDWRRYRHDPTNRDVAQPNWAVSIGGKNLFPEKEMIGVSGRAGKGKSQFSIQLFGSLAFNVPLLDITPLRKPRQTLFVDGEQSEFDTAFRLNAMFRTLGIQEFSSFPNNVEYLRLRSEPDNAKKKEITMEAIADLKPDLIFIDPLTDLIYDIEDKNEGVQLVNILLSKIDELNANLFAVVHQNEGGDSLKLRENVGSELMRKCRQLISVDVKNGGFEATTTKGIPFTYQWKLTQSGAFADILSSDEQTSELEKQQMTQVFAKIIGPKKSRTFETKKNLLSCIGEHIGSVSEFKNNEYLERAEVFGIIKKPYDGHKYKLQLTSNNNQEGKAANVRG